MHLPKRESELFECFVRDYWEYYRELEDDFLATKKFVAFEESNFGTFSLEFLKLYQAVCSEIDVVGKAIASEVDETFQPDDKKNNIYKWWFCIQDTYRIGDFSRKSIQDYEDGKLIADCTVECLSRFRLSPWLHFRISRGLDKRGMTRFSVVNGSVPSWWSDYNSVKHHRKVISSSREGLTNYRKANLGNLLNAFAGLYLLEIAYLQSVGTLDDLEAFMDESRLFVKRRWMTSSDIEKMFE